MKKSLLWLLIALLTVSMIATFSLVGCKEEAAAPAEEEEEAAGEEAEEEAPAEEAKPAEEITIRALIRPDEGRNVEIFTQKFEDETGINVEVDFVSWAEIHDKTLIVLTGGGGGYDIIFIPSANALEFLSGGWFEPIDDMIPAEERDQWLESVINLYTYDGQLLALPWYSGGDHMVYNSAYLEEAGVDPEAIKTWDDFYQACLTIKEKGILEYPYTPSSKYPGCMYHNWGAMVYSMGGQLFDESGNPVFNEGSGLEALELLAKGTLEDEIFDPAGIAMDDYETLINYINGNAAFLLDSTWAATQTVVSEDSQVSEVSKLMLIPGSEENRTGMMMYAGGFGLLKTSEHKEEAKQYMEYLTSEEAQKQHATEGANAPTRVVLFDDPDIAANWVNFEILAQQLSYGTTAPQYLWLEEWRKSLATAVQDALAGRKTAKEALDWAAEEAQRLAQQ